MVEIYREREQMRYPVDVFTGKVRDYTGSRPSAIAKVQVDGELMLTELGLTGDEQAEKKIHGGPDRALCHYPREHYQHWKQAFPEQTELFVAPAFGENLSTEGLTEDNVYIGDIFQWGSVDSGHAATLAVLQAKFPFWHQRYGQPDAGCGQDRLAVQRYRARAGIGRRAVDPGVTRERRQCAGGDCYCLAYAV